MVDAATSSFRMYVTYVTYVVTYVILNYERKPNGSHFDKPLASYRSTYNCVQLKVLGRVRVERTCAAVGLLIDRVQRSVAKQDGCLHTNMNCGFVAVTRVDYKCKI